MLIRTAHFSIAYIEHLDQQRLRELVEAVFRYSGTGCRSVAVLITPEPMRESICHFTDTVEEFWIRNPQHKKPTKSLYHRYAYNRAIKREQAWLDDFLIEKSRMYPHQPFIMHWIEGDRSDAESFIREYGDGLQSVYRSRIEAIDDSIAGRIVEPIDSAQNPPIDWTPDGIDPIEWLVSERPHEELR